MSDGNMQLASAPESTPAERRVVIERQPLITRLTFYVVAALLIAFAVWAALTQLDEIARGQGKVIPVSKTQIIQSSEPGIVQEIAVSVGQIVHKGDLLLRLDDTATTASLGEASARQRALKAQIARLEIEQNGGTSPYRCPSEIAAVAPAICDNEARLMQARADSLANKAAQMQERYQQRLKELSETHQSIARLETNRDLTQQELDLLEPIVKRKLAPQTELLRVQKELADTKGQLKLYRETLDRVQASVNEARLEMDDMALSQQQEALAQKTQALAELSVIEETIRGAESRVAATDIRSPVEGIVNTMEVNTVGAYVNAGAVVAGIVPTSDKLLIEARIAPADVAFVRPGQHAVVKITAYDFTIYGGLEGVVETVSADSLVDQKKGEPYYVVRIRTEKSELTRYGKTYPIMPGMIASADIITGKKTVLASLLKPLEKAQSEALRER